MHLPQFTDSVRQNPRKLFLFSHTKVGKTTLVASLPNSLLIDLEDGSEFVAGTKFNVLKYSKENDVFPTKALKDLSLEIQKQNKEKKDYVYDYIILDTATGLEKFARVLGTYLYKKTTQGKNYNGDDVVAELPNGAGYDWLRKAFDIIYGWFSGLAKEALVITGHVKQSSINKQGKDLNAQDIFLTGKLKQIMAADCDAIGYLYRNKENTNQVIASFKTHELDLATGARSKHLRNQEFVISELFEDDFKFYWDKIFINNKEK